MDSLQKGTDTETDTEPPCTADGDCDDGVDCTADTCDENGECDSYPENDQCDYLHYCHPQQGCIPTGDECKVASDCDDEVDCTVDTCILAGEFNTCENDPDHSYCESDDLCIEDETCSPITGCIDGTPIECTQTTAPCMDSVCNSLTGVCEDVMVDGSDDDFDTYLDVLCGGDDCDDEDEDVYPSAPEDCDDVDDDCDGYTDLTVIADAITVATGPELLAPSLAFDGTSWGVVWQQGIDSAGEVYARFLNSNGAMVSDPHNFTSLGGASSIGNTPDVVSATDRFYVAWASKDGADPTEALLVDLMIDTGTGGVTQGTLVQLETGTATSVSAPSIAWDGASGGSGWVAAWVAQQSGGDNTVELQTQDMHSMPASSSFLVSTGTEMVDGVDVAVLGEDDIMVAYSRADTGTDADLEVFETRVELASGDVWDHQSGYPAMISAADGSGDDDSFEPCVSTNGSGGWVTAYTDTEIIGTVDTLNVEGWDGATNHSLVDSASYRQSDPAWAWDGDWFGLLYLSSVGSAVALEFAQYDDSVTQAASPYQGTRFSLVTGGEDLQEPRLIATGSGGYGALVIYNDGTQDNLIFYAFEGCAAATK